MTYHGRDLDETLASARSPRIRIAVFVLVAAAGIGAFVFRDTIWSGMTRVLAAGEEDPVPTQKLEQVAFQLQVPAFGEITGLESTPVATPGIRSGGLKIAWLIPEGAFVQKGDVVVRFDSTEALLNLERQQNTLEANQERTRITTGKQSTDEKVLTIDRTDAEKDYEYAITVMPQDETIFSKWDIIEAQINAGFAKERIDFLSNKGRVQKRIARADQQILAIEKSKAQAEMTIAQETLNSLELRAPADGLVIYRRQRMNREPQLGDESWQGEVLVEIVDLAALQARVYVLERDAGSLSVGAAVAIRLDSIPEKTFNGRIRSLAALAQPLERNSPLKYFNCEVSIHDAGQDLRRIKPGMALKADVILANYDSCFVVPASAVSTKGTDTLVYIQSADTFVPRPVELGAGTHGQAVIVSGVQENEIVAMRHPFETRKSHLPDFSKAAAGEAGPGGFGGRRMGEGVRIMMR